MSIQPTSARDTRSREAVARPGYHSCITEPGRLRTVERCDEIPPLHLHPHCRRTDGAKLPVLRAHRMGLCVAMGPQSDSRFGVNCRSVAALPTGSARPPIRDSFAASPKMPALGQQPTLHGASSTQEMCVSKTPFCPQIPRRAQTLQPERGRLLRACSV
jgi:hypothetical protein